MTEVSALWMRRDLRLTDNRAMHEMQRWVEAEEGRRWFLVFHLDPDFYEYSCPHHDYFFQNLEKFRKECDDQHIQLYFLHGSADEAFIYLKKKVPALTHLFFNEDETPRAAQRDEQVLKEMEQRSVETHAYKDAHFHRSDEVKKKDGGLYSVYTPYYRTWRQLEKEQPYECRLDQIISQQAELELPQKDAYQKLSSYLNNSGTTWERTAEEDGRQRLETFVEEIAPEYHETNNALSRDGTSRLSAYLKTGRLSVRTIYQALSEQLEEGNPGAEAFVGELAWRDYYNMIHATRPELKNKELKEAYRDLPWEYDEKRLQTWKDGRTGYPIVDACMRQLNEIGWMHNRGRMIAASFLTKDYLIDWREGERYFAERLIDYDPSSNAGGWQWAASTGTDAVPYFRVFSPVRQSERFDPQGDYIREYVPELQSVPKKYIHTPWKMNEQQQKEYGCIVGQDYPAPDVDHAVQRKKAIEMFKGE